jgi:hypothetical protein
VQPVARQQHIVFPGVPACVAKIAAAVAAAVQVKLQHADALRRQRARGQRGHAARAVHLFGERMDVDQRAAALALGAMEQAVA